MFNQEKIEELKKIKQELGKLSTTQVINILGEDIIELVNKGTTLKLLSNKLSEKLDTKISYEYLSQWIKKMKDDIKKNTELKEEKTKIDKQKIIVIVNFKGGVGKSTIANLLDLPNKVVVNLDTQNAKNSNYSDTLNYLELKQEYGININETIELLKEEGKEWIVFDTPGNISEELLEVIDKIDYVIVPFTKGKRSRETTIDSINSLVEIMDNDNVKFALILNMYQDEKDIDEELRPIEDEAREILQDKLKCSIGLKFSKAVSTIEKEQKSIDELDLTNKIAYKAFKKRVNEMNKQLKECLFKI
jgi:MinD-like ATPase involved in chromosome partitioning or flagellar assembly